MRRLLVNNPVSGNHRSTTLACEIARDRGYQVWDTEKPGDAFELAHRAAVEGVDAIIASGGDGTVNEVIHGVDHAGMLRKSRLGVVPTGTGNGFAKDIGISSVRSAFDAIESGHVRLLDLGTANDHLFIKTCSSGFPATLSAHTTHEMKRFFGLTAYGLGAVPSALDALQSQHADTLPKLHARVGSEDDPMWTGTAAMVLIGNSRRFPGLRYRQAPMEDGLLEVVVVKRPSVVQTLRRAEPLAMRFDSPYLLRTQTAELEIEAPAPTLFSLDGEIIERTHLTISVRPKAVQFCVGDQYEY
ncbi:diacylglycerol/lipid kinase family protein [Halomarina rubra]|uniref:Diacylglycerol/lipid kinase family protein n=1 Tax=Halomarina rubra TaxID=2071873 RepID=A0ABD6AVL5_9EURY|nr:diacylglycerol kinase family protein [Halomarina rubra]